MADGYIQVPDIPNGKKVDNEVTTNGSGVQVWRQRVDANLKVGDSAVSDSNPVPVNLFTESSEVSESNPVPFEEVLNPEPFLEYAHKHTGTISTLAVATNSDGSDYIIELVDASSFNVGDNIQISNGNVEPTFAEIMAKATNVLTLDRRVDYGHPIGTEVEVVSYAMNVNGSLATPQEFVVNPEGSQIVHIQRLILAMTHAASGDLGKFGGIAALTNGVVLRIRRNGQYKTISNWKTNADIKVDMFDVEFDARSGGQGDYGTSGRWTFENFGTELRLDALTNDVFEVYVQDDLSTLVTFTMKAEGHYTNVA